MITIGSRDEIESPWVPFALFIIFLIFSIIAIRIFLRELNG